MAERMMGTASVAALCADREPVVRANYDRFLDALGALGPYREEPKKTSIPLARGVGFAGVHPRKGSLVLTLRTDRPIANPRVVKTEQVSPNRYHNEVKLSSPDEVDAEVVGWLRDASTLG